MTLACAAACGIACSAQTDSTTELALTKLATDIKDLAKAPPPNNQLMSMMLMAMMLMAMMSRR